jgi:hypothetical protein
MKVDSGFKLEEMMIFWKKIHAFNVHIIKNTEVCHSHDHIFYQYFYIIFDVIFFLVGPFLEVKIVASKTCVFGGKLLSDISYETS